MHEGGISTPLVAHWPAGIAARGELRHTPTHFVDFVPTALELAGVSKPSQWEGEPIPAAPGKSLLPAFAADTLIPRDSLWWLHEGNRAIRMGDWKLVAAKNEPWELYDLRTDRAEQHNLAAQMPDKANELAAAWQRQTDEITELARKTASPSPKPAGKSALPISSDGPRRGFSATSHRLNSEPGQRLKQAHPLPPSRPG